MGEEDGDFDCLSQDSALLQTFALRIRVCCQNLSDSSLFMTWGSRLIFHAGQLQVSTC